MPDLHIPTALMIIGAMYIVLPGITWLVLARQRTPQVMLWCLGGVLLGVSALLAGQHGRLPEALTILLPGCLFLAAHFIRITSLRLDLRLPLRTRWVLLAFAAVYLTYLWLHLAVPDASWRVRFNAGATAVLITYLAWLAWRISQVEQSRNAQWIAGVYALVGSALLLRMLSISSGDGTTHLMGSGLATQWLSVCVLLSSVMGHVGYVGLALDRAMRRERQAAAEQARKEENRRLGAQIAHLDRQRSLGELSAALAHEIKQPLTAILTNAQVAQRGMHSGALDAPKLGVLLEKIVHNTQRASQIVERVRDYIRPSPARTELVQLQQVVQEVLTLVAADAQEKRVAIQLPARHPPVWVTGDAIALSQIVLNILRNAIDALAHAPKRDIVVDVATDTQHATLRIHDSGPGLSAQQLAQAGTPFFSTKPDGLGLGLSISKTIAEQHGGALTLRNHHASQGGGAVVELTLPLPGLPTR